ncbi:MAG: hypothetical protein ACKVS6_01445 [Planctomycetota bacterium]
MKLTVHFGVHSSVHVFFASLLALGAGGCVTRTWRDRALAERPDLHTPIVAFETLRAAIRLDNPMLAYRTISEEMKSRDQFTQIMFISGWDAFFTKHPLARFAGNAEIVTLVNEGGGRRAHTIATAHGKTIEMIWVRQDYYEIHIRGRNAPIDGYLDTLANSFSSDGAHIHRLLATVNDMRLAEVKPADIESFLIASEWKLFDMRSEP